MPETDSSIDAYAPKQIAGRVENAGIAKANMGLIPTLMLAILAGAFIAFGGAFYTLVITDSGLGFGPTKMLGGLAFSTGLIMVIVGGAELYTGNNLLAMAWADRKVTSLQLARNGILVFLGNFIGAIGTAVLVGLSGTLDANHGGVAATAVSIAEAKIALSPSEAFFRGILCNVMVCLAVWLCFSARTVIGKVAAIIFPVSAFVALGFEHSVANMYLIPIGYLAGSEHVTLGAFFYNLIPVTIGNTIGGGGFVALVYWVIYLRKA